MSNPVQIPRVLVIEDDELTLLVLSELLMGEGFICHPFSCPLEALNFAATANDVTAVLTDIKMPKLSGIEFVRRLKESDGPALSVPVICVSGNASREDVKSALRLGVFDFLDKPVDPEQLIDTLHRAHSKYVKAKVPPLEVAEVTGSTSLSSSKSEMLDLFAHEMRTPLNGILGFSALMSDTNIAYDKARYQEMAQNIQTCGLDLLEKVNLLIGIFSEESQCHKAAKSTLVSTVIEQTLRKAPQIVQQNRHRIHVEDNTSGTAWFVDVMRTSDALIQILKNAFQHSLSGDTVSLRAIRLCQELTLEVTNTGSFIDRQTLEKVHQPFGRADASKTRVTEGLGLGIPYAIKKIESQGGKFEIDSAPERGTSVRFIFGDHIDEQKFGNLRVVS